jgi:hypothetical protein
MLEGLSSDENAEPHGCRRVFMRTSGENLGHEYLKSLLPLEILNFTP